MIYCCWASSLLARLWFTMSTTRLNEVITADVTLLLRIVRDWKLGAVRHKLLSIAGSVRGSDYNRSFHVETLCNG